MRVPFAFGDRSYEAIVAPGARHELPRILRERAPHAKALIVVTSADIAAQPWFDDIALPLDHHTVFVPSGEAAKQPSEVANLCETFAAHGLSRDDVVVAIGGGAVTDLAGFAAAVYMRGIAVVHIATTLAAQVDAALGGKTGVNLSSGKNLMGAFHQPIAVLCDRDVLTTLPAREYRAGLGEVAKCWLLAGRTAAELDISDDAAIQLAIETKAAIVSADEREGGLRALLNYGHTLAHALEAAQFGDGERWLLHGEAVAIGLGFAAHLAHRLGRVPETYLAETAAVLAHWELPSSLPPGQSVDGLLAAMARDKKAHHDFTFVLPGPDGFATVRGISADDVRAELVRWGAR